MLSAVQKILTYALLTVGMLLALFAFPLSYVVFAKYGPSIFGTLGGWGVPVEVRYFLVVFLSVPLILIGSYLLHSQWRFLRLGDSISRNMASGFTLRVQLQQAYCALVLLFTALSPLTNLMALGLVVLIFLISHIDYPPSGSQKVALYGSTMIQVGLAIGEFAIAFVVARSFWRLLQSTRASRTAEG